MKRLTKLAQTGTLLAGLAVVPVMAQTTPAPEGRDMNTPRAGELRDMPRTTDMDDNDFDFGWLGLLGLAGLAGLGRKRHVHQHTDTIDTTNRMDTDRDRM